MGSSCNNSPGTSGSQFPHIIPFLRNFWAMPWTWPELEKYLMLYRLKRLQTKSDSCSLDGLLTHTLRQLRVEVIVWTPNLHIWPLVFACRNRVEEFSGKYKISSKSKGSWKTPCTHHLGHCRTCKMSKVYYLKNWLIFPPLNCLSFTHLRRAYNLFSAHCGHLNGLLCNKGISQWIK